MTGDIAGSPERVDPQKILRNMMSVQTFAGVPVFIIDPETVPDDRNALPCFFEDLIGQGDRPESASLLELYRTNAETILSSFHKFDWSSQQFQRRRVITPWILCNAAEPATQAAIIVAPGAHWGADEMIQGIGGLSRDGLPPLTEDNTIWRYQALCHELGHAVAGIKAEAEADKTGALFCRRAFPLAREPAIQADMRVLDAVYNGYLLSEEENDSFTQMLIKDFSRYGWGCVESCDAVLCLPQDRVSAMTDEEIIAHRLDVCSIAASDLFSFGREIKTSNASSVFDVMHLSDVAHGAEQFWKEIKDANGSSKTSAIAQRFASAARRLEGGQNAYTFPLPGSREGPVCFPR